MENLLFVLLGIGIWQLVVFLTIIITDEDEQKIYTIGMGFVGWILYGIAIIFVKLTKWYDVENQTKRLVKAVNKQLKKDNKNWLKWYDKYGKYNNKAWNNLRKEHTELVKQMFATGFNYNKSK